MVTYVRTVKMKTLSLLLVCALPSVVFSCLCWQILSRKQTIENTFCGEYSRPDVYTARVVGATCNCIPASGESDANRLHCQDYTFATGNTSVVDVDVVPVLCRPYGGEPTCSRLAASLVGSGITVEDVTTNLPPVGNRTDEYGYCSSCPFKNMSLVTLQPCVYTVEVTRVFKGNYIQRGETLVVPGPDVVTSCGEQGRVLQLREEYVVGIGGFCSQINEWSTVDSYSRSELELLRDLALGCQNIITKGPLSSGAIAGVVLGGLVFLIVLAVITACVCALVYSYRHPTSKIGLFMIEHHPKTRYLNEKSASYNVESGKTVVNEKE